MVCNIESEESVTPNNQPTPAPQALPLRGAGVFWGLESPNTRTISWKPIFARFLCACIVSILLSIASWARAATQEAQFLSEIRQVIFEGKRSGEGYFSPDDQNLIFQSEREPTNPFYQIYLLDLQTGDVHRVSPGIGKTTCAFFRPGSDHVIFASTHHDARAQQKMQAELEFRASGQQRRYAWDYDEEMEIWSSHRDGSQLKRLTSAKGYDAEGSYSPDGKLIVFSSNRHAYSDPLSPDEQKRLETDRSYFCDIYLMNADGSNVRRLTQTKGYDGGPFFSPDGQQIIWRRFDESGVIANILVMKLDGSDVHQLTDFGCMAWAPYFHPSGAYVIFTANKLGFENFELFIVDAFGKREPVRVTYKKEFDGLPVFSPDGEKLCWTSARTSDQKSQLFMARWNHAAALKSLEASPLRSTSYSSSRVTSNSVNSTGSSSLPAQASTAAQLKSDVEYLASDLLEGRETGTPGAHKAAAFLVEKLQSARLKPAADTTNFRQQFQFTSGVKTLPEKSQLSITKSKDVTSFEVEKDFRPLSFTANDSFEGEIVFAGYGLSVPSGAGASYNSYEGLNVSNKIALVLRYVPEEVPAKRRQELNVYAGLRYKAMIARQHGAKALLVVAGPNSPNAGQLAPLTFDTSLAGSGIIAASISSNVADQIFSTAGKEMKAVQSSLDNEKPHAQNGQQNPHEQLEGGKTVMGSFPIPNLSLKISTGIQQLRKTDDNIIASVPPVDDPNNSEYVLIGAHYDHLGRGESRSLERAGEEGQIHNGADDNASGVSVALELARSFAEERARHPENFKRGLLFAFWSGEELGIIGSSHFAEQPSVPLSNIVAYVNFDMVGRLTDNKLNLQGVGSSSAWRKLVEKRNVMAGFDVALQEDPYLPTDVTAIYPKGIPVMHFFTGSHEDYHRPTDKADKINYEGMERIAKFARGIISDLLSNPARPDYVKVAQSDTRTGGGREQLRAYLGTVPDYAQEVEGVKLSAVRKGGPGEKGGLQGGDIIIEFGEQQIKNIYDYTYALDAVKIGKPVNIVVLREGKRLKLTVVPEARK
jgi:Tol biopolymer transport system component